MRYTNLPSHLDSYLNLRRALGYKPGYEKTAVRQFVRFLESQNDAVPLRAETIIRWACAVSPRAGQAAQYRRLCYARHFLTYLKAFFPETEIPPLILADARRPRAYIFSEEQVVRMLAATWQLWPAGSLKQLTLETLLGLLTSTGLRIGEALRLTIRDLQVNQEPSRLEIYHTKFRKSRFVPVHPTTADRLRVYLRQRYKLAGEDSTAALFLRAPDKPLLYGTTLYCFHKITQFIGIPKLPGGRGPSLHALRHTFAVRRLVSWYRAGLDVRSLLPHLAVYRGHLGFLQSYHYLTATPELLTAAAEKFANSADLGGDQ